MKLTDFLLIAAWFVLYPLTLWAVAWFYATMIGLLCDAWQ